MTNPFSSIPFMITGDKKAEVQKFGTKSVNRVNVLALLAIIPALLWLCTGYLAATQIFYLDKYAGLGIGVGLAAFIFLFDLVIIRSEKIGWVAGIRIMVALMIAAIGSFFLDTVIFGKDIEAYAITKHLETRKKEKGELNTDRMAIQKSFLDQMNGKTIYPPGYGPIAKRIEIEIIKAEMNTAKHDSLAQLETNILSNPEHPSYRTKLAELGLLSFSKRISTFFELKNDHPFILTIWILLLVVMVMLEAMPAIIKTWSRETAYELHLAHIELNAKSKMDRMREMERQWHELPEPKKNSRRHLMKVAGATA